MFAINRILSSLAREIGVIHSFHRFFVKVQNEYARPVHCSASLRTKYTTGLLNSVTAT